MDAKNNIIDFSVLILCFNPDIEKIKKTIISIVNQKGLTYEIIVSDDGSKIDYKSSLMKWCDDNGVTVKTFNFLKQNVGTVKHILSDLDHCSGQYVAALGPGDIFFNESSLLDYKLAFEKESCDAVFSDAIYYYDDYIYKKREYPQNSRIFKSKRMAPTR